jgi:hypothetical protein
LLLGTLVVALVSLLPLAVGASFWHVDAAGSEASCPICHVGHMPILPGNVASVDATPCLVAWIVPAESQIASPAPSGLDSPPRAPPFLASSCSN